MKKFLLLILIGLSTLAVRAEEIVAMWSVYGYTNDDNLDNIQKVDDPLLAWIQVDGDKLTFETWFSDLKNVRLKGIEYKGEHSDNKDRIFAAPFADMPGELFIVIPKGENEVGFISYLENPQKLTLMTFYGNKDIKDLLYVEVASDPEVKGNDTLEDAYKYVKQHLESQK